MEKKTFDIEGKSPTKEELKWLDYVEELHFKTPERLEDLAKFLSGMISISLTIFLMGDEKILEKLDPRLVKAVSILWLLSMIGVFIVLFQRRLFYIDKSVDSIKKVHSRVIRFKYMLLLLTVILFASALIILSGAILFR